MKSESQRKPATGGYWHEARQPMVSLVFIAPFLLCYEAGVLVLGGDAVRNGADVWLRQFLDLFGFGQYFLLPALCCGILLAWHHLTRQPWRLRPSVFYGMALESLVLGFGLLLVAHWQSTLFATASWPLAAPVAAADGGTATVAVGQRWLATLSGYCGAGVYEELLFRLMLVPAALALLRAAGIPRHWDVVTAIVLTSVLFALAHYELSFEMTGRTWANLGETFAWYSFVFRFLAGAFFAALFLYRGFGIAAGTHALYDIFTVLAG